MHLNYVDLKHYRFRGALGASRNVATVKNLTKI
nr:MAG TPA: hypothetical protein [Caudoviricetes sp.]